MFSYVAQFESLKHRCFYHICTNGKHLHQHWLTFEWIDKPTTTTKCDSTKLAQKIFLASVCTNCKLLLMHFISFPSAFSRNHLRHLFSAVTTREMGIVKCLILEEAHNIICNGQTIYTSKTVGLPSMSYSHKIVITPKKITPKVKKFLDSTQVHKLVFVGNFY